MNELRMILVAALCGAVLVACSDDPVRMPTDLGIMRDMNMPPMDMGPPVDSGPPMDGGPRVDGGPMGTCPAGECDLVANGCPAGEGCYFLSMGAGMPAMPLCDTSGIGTLGASCMTYSNCAAGFVCQNATATVPGTCEKYCCDVGSSAGCPSGASCSVVLTDMSGNPTGAALCRSPANCPIFGSSCPAGQACYISGGDGTTDCAMAGDVAAGGACMFTNDCLSGFSCLGAAGSATCRKLCDTVDMDPACTGTDVCTSLGIAAPLANVGSCNPP